MEFGSVIHDGVPVWWDTGDRAAVQAAVRASYARRERWLPGPKELHTLELAEFMMVGYEAQGKIAGDHWAHAAGDWRIWFAEERVIVDLGLEARLSFQMDRIATRSGETEMYVLVDTKTASKYYWGKRWRQQWPRSLQQQLYQWAVKNVYEIELDGHFIEGMKKDVPLEMEYVELPLWSDAQLEEAVDQFKRWMQQHAELVERCKTDAGEVDVDLLFTTALTETDYSPTSCFDFGGCPFLPLCEAEPGDRLGLLYDGFEYVPPTYLD
jgi:hypothetical protein